jgi:uncharacterized protein YqeY
MSIKKELHEALQSAIKAKDEMRKNTLRMALTSIRMAEDRKREELDDDEVLGVLQKEVKSRQETIADARKAERPNLIVEAEAQITILEEYLPKPLSQDELEELARQSIEEAGAESPREMGQVMKILIPKLGGRATGQEASQAVRKLLQEG